MRYQAKAQAVWPRHQAKLVWHLIATQLWCVCMWHQETGQLDSRSQRTQPAVIQLCDRPAAMGPAARQGILEFYMATRAEVWAMSVSPWMSQGMTPSRSRARVLQWCEHRANLSNTDTLALLCFRSLWVEVSKSNPFSFCLSYYIK